mmetsp:Transcript_10854/g.27035  ORF Transcript_10854/g.27035 Transcript_10854/m.27035 type:complete len:205 (+) Transcript_10854:907-1521(+)
MLKPRAYEESRPDLTSVSTLAAEEPLACFELSFQLSRVCSDASRKVCRSGAVCSVGWHTTRCTKRCSCERRSSSHSAEKPTPLTRIVCTVALCFSGSGGTMTPGYLAVSWPCTQSKSRKRRVTENWPNLYCGSEVLVVTSYVKWAEMPCPSMHGLVTVTSKLGDDALPALAWLPGPGSTLDSKREAGCAPPAGAGVEMSRSWNA